MVSLDLKDYEPPNPFEHAANALDPLAFIAMWPKKTREARLTVVKVLRALRDIEDWAPTVEAGGDNVVGCCTPSDGETVDIWKSMIDEILSHAPPEMLE